MERKPDDQLQHADGDCDRPLIAAFVAGALSSLDREQVVAHLGRCRECREALALMTPEEGPPPPAALSLKKAA